MKIAVPTRSGNVDNHFGHCEAYTIFSLGTNHEIVATEMLPSPQGCGCKSNIASVLKGKGVGVMLAGNMGAGALNVLSNHGIKVYHGCSGNVQELVKAFITGNIEDSGVGCQHHHEHGEDHVCNH